MIATLYCGTAQAQLQVQLPFGGGKKDQPKSGQASAPSVSLPG